MLPKTLDQRFRVLQAFYLVVFFLLSRPEDAERGLEACRGKMFLGAEMDLHYWQGESGE